MYRIFIFNYIETMRGNQETIFFSHPFALPYFENKRPTNTLLRTWNHRFCLTLTEISVYNENAFFSSSFISVRSYGTEDRDTQYPIHPQNQVYEYILFRGSDIKDIRVINSVPVPNDPAIMQMHLPQAQPSFPNGQYAGNMAHMGTPMAGQSFGNLYAPMSASFTSQSMAPGAGSLNKSKQSSELNIAIPEPSSTTQLLDQGVMVNFDLE